MQEVTIEAVELGVIAKFSLWEQEGEIWCEFLDATVEGKPTDEDTLEAMGVLVDLQDAAYDKFRPLDAQDTALDNLGDDLLDLDEDPSL